VAISCAPRTRTITPCEQKPMGCICMAVTCLMTVVLSFLDNRGFVGSHKVKMKNWRFYSYGYFVDKNHRFHLPAKQCGVR